LPPVDAPARSENAVISWRYTLKPVAWINVSSVAAPPGGADAPTSLAKILGYVCADIAEQACPQVARARARIG
jgi:hypothetical protein